MLICELRNGAVLPVVSHGMIHGIIVEPSTHGGGRHMDTCFVDPAVSKRAAAAGAEPFYFGIFSLSLGHRLLFIVVSLPRFSSLIAYSIL